MSTIPHYLLISQSKFTDGPFAAWVKRVERSRVGWTFSQALTFLIKASQDILHLSECRIRTPRLREEARLQRVELARRQELLLATLLGTVSLDELFSPQHERMRHAVYHLAAEALRATSDHQRILLLLVLKPACDIINEQVRRLLGFPGEAYLAPEIPAGYLRTYLAGLDLDDPDHDNAVEAMDDAYQALAELLDALGQESEHDLARQGATGRDS